MATKEEVLEKLKTGVVDYQEEDVKEASQAGLDEGFDALEFDSASELVAKLSQSF